MHQRRDRQIDSRARERMSRHRPGSGSGPGRRSPSTPARLRCTWKPPAEVPVHTVPSPGRRAREYTGPMTDGDGRGAWALFPSLPPSLPPLRRVLWAPPALTDEKKRRNPGLDEQMDARRSHPIMPHHFKGRGPSAAGWIPPGAPRSMPCPPCLALLLQAAAGCTLLSGFRITLAHTPSIINDGAVLCTTCTWETLLMSPLFCCQSR